MANESFRDQVLISLVRCTLPFIFSFFLHLKPDFMSHLSSAHIRSHRPHNSWWSGVVRLSPCVFCLRGTFWQDEWQMLVGQGQVASNDCPQCIRTKWERERPPVKDLRVRSNGKPQGKNNERNRLCLTFKCLFFWQDITWQLFRALYASIGSYMSVILFPGLSSNFSFSN